jgi:hypothetical protein
VDPNLSLILNGSVRYKMDVVSSLWSTSARVHGGLAVENHRLSRCLGAKEA